MLHLLTFFALTLAFYWILDTNRRRTLNLTLIVCTAGLGVGSECLQAVLPNGRVFDLLDLVANVVGSLAAVALCSWYHKRMLERKRSRKQYNPVPGEDLGDGDDNLELGESAGLGDATSDRQQEEGVISGDGDTSAAASGQRATTLEEEVDNWDENAVDAWDEDDLGDIGVASVAAGKDSEANGGHGAPKKRAD